MNQATLGLAHKLLNKAQSTDFEAEAAALTERAYRLLADALNDYDRQSSVSGLARKRERRHLRDRRSASVTPNMNVPPGMPKATGTRPRPAKWIDLPVRGQVDLRV